MKLKKVLSVGSAVAIAMTLATACGSANNSSTGSSGGTTASNPSKSGSSSDSGKIALLLPDTTSSARYETQDKPDFTKEVQKLNPKDTVMYENAQGSSTTQQQQAEAAITNGAKVLVIDPVDSQAAAAIVHEANQAGVKVISYDRLITKASVDYYVSFNNEEVGKLQGQFIADHTPKGGTVVMINGAQTDNNALLFAKGAHEVLDPLFKNGTLKLGYETYTPNWDPKNGLREMEQALTKLNNKVDSVLSANDGLAGSIIQALNAQHLAGKVPVTGQDATDAGLHNILQGTQSMTVYKAVPEEAKVAAQLAVDLVSGKTPGSDIVNGQTDNGSGKNIPSVLLKPVVVNKNNIQDTVIKDGFTTMEKIKNPS
ncbi:sugar ABC transporter substrate-binding protein [Fodinisporobacter ferrooxydans]|uniref:Sugar ABC transporter substrate-binding protein n=1 Tax=Fodinisporobacter ferrooxydans TaxID=2901836 RepID=A0ABY4CLR8_9BACL|nr:sugar ABC transporter substrate-binding protein [Alicyclobacillaceae bacterium MYW30-H2]